MRGQRREGVENVKPWFAGPSESVIHRTVWRREERDSTEETKSHKLSPKDLYV